MDDNIKIHAPEDALGPKEKKNHKLDETNCQSHNLTSQPQVTVPAGCNLKWSNCQTPMARIGWRRGRIVITSVPEMKISAATVIPTPETMVLPDTGRNGVTRPFTIPVIIIVQHQLRDGPVTEAGSGVQCLAWQLLPVLVIVIQRDSRDHRGGLMLRTRDAVQRPSWQLHPCRSTRPPAVVIRLVIWDQHSRYVTRVVDVVQQSFGHLHLRPGTGHWLHTIPSHPAMVGMINTQWKCLRNLQIQSRQEE